MFHRHSRDPLGIIIRNQERLMAAIADLATATVDLTAAVTAAVDVLTTPPADVTHLSAVDQSTLDATVSAVRDATAHLTAAVAPAAPVEAPAPDAPADPTV